MMHKPVGKLILLLLLIGLFSVQQVPAIDGDYSNPYATDPQGNANDAGNMIAPVWNGNPIYGGKDKELPVMTLVGAGFLLFGIGTGVYCRIRERRQRITVS